MDRPILFSGAMVKAILAGRKTMTRRVVKFAYDQHDGWAGGVHPDGSGRGWIAWHPGSGTAAEAAFTMKAYPGPDPQGFLCPYGIPGDRLWVRERVWQRPERTPAMMRDGADTWVPWEYDADQTEGDRETLRAQGWRNRPSIHMPREACRIVLAVEDVRVERLHEITDADALREGVTAAGTLLPRAEFAALWDAINGTRAPWTSNPWVWRVEFRRAQEAPHA